MALTAEKIPGVTVDVADLINVRSRLAGLSLKRIRHRTSRSSGLRETRVRGRGMEYEESRAYIAGDDVRTMDWRVMARTGEPHTKVFTEEKERSVMLVVDLSSSMFFGTRFGFKSYTAAQTAAHIGWLVVQAGDRLGGLIASSSAHYEIRPKKSSSNLMQIFHHLEHECNIDLPVANEPSQLNFMLAELRRVVKPGTIIVMVSDLLGINGETPALMSSLARNNDLMAFWVHDRTETHLWPQGRYELLANENQISLDLRADSASKWLTDEQQSHKSTIEQLANQFKMWMSPVSCNEAVTPQLLKYLKG